MRVQSVFVALLFAGIAAGQAPQRCVPVMRPGVVPAVGCAPCGQSCQCSPVCPCPAPVATIPGPQPFAAWDGKAAIPPGWEWVGYPTAGYWRSSRVAYSTTTQAIPVTVLEGKTIRQATGVQAVPVVTVTQCPGGNCPNPRR